MTASDDAFSGEESMTTMFDGSSKILYMSWMKIALDAFATSRTFL